MSMLKAGISTRLPQATAKDQKALPNGLGAAATTS